MTGYQITLALTLALALITVVYTIVGWKNIASCYRMWFTKAYWINYNIIEAVSWVAKATIIIPGLIFGVQIWQLYSWLWPPA